MDIKQGLGTFVFRKQESVSIRSSTFEQLFHFGRASNAPQTFDFFSVCCACFCRTAGAAVVAALCSGMPLSSVVATKKERNVLIGGGEFSRRNVRRPAEGDSSLHLSPKNFKHQPPPPPPPPCCRLCESPSTSHSAGKVEERSGATNEPLAVGRWQVPGASLGRRSRAE